MTSILPLVIQNVSVRKQGKTILDAVSLEYSSTGFTIVMGPNGAGKTTLLRLMHGLERPRNGSLTWSCSETEARSRQAFVFQTPVMMRRSVLDNIAYPLTVGGMAKAAAREQAAQWADDVRLNHAHNLEAGSLSGGERQKLALARALIGKPELLFLDEPTANLDGKSTREIETILQSAYDRGTRIIMTTHDIGQSKRLATDVVFLNKGKLCEHSTHDVFFSSAQSEQARTYLSGDIVE